MAALPMAEPARLVGIIGIGLGEEPAQPLFFVRGEQPGADAPLGRVGGLVGHADGYEPLPAGHAVRIDRQHRYILALHVGDEHGPAVGRYGHPLRRDAACKLDAGLREDSLGRRGVLVDAEDFDLV